MTIKSFAAYHSKERLLICRNEWNLNHLVKIKKQLHQMVLPKTGDLDLDASAITNMDSAGAWLLNNFLKKLKEAGLTLNVKNLSSEAESLINIVEKRAILPEKVPIIRIPNSLARLGKSSYLTVLELLAYLSFVGELAFEWLRLLFLPHKWRWRSLSSVIERTGVEALPIIALLSFMIGVVISYQMGNQLRNYGANAFIVNLLGLSILREFGPLITAIMVAGRTGSAFTAQLGTMKINQEIDALNTMGVSPSGLLLLPRIIGLTIALPLLTMWADIFGVAGGMLMANNMLGITWIDFINRFQHEIPMRSLLIGLGKAPVFALIIASVGCFQGMRVERNADSVGTHTTRSVVLAIFFIIVADAIFSVIFSKLNL